MIIAGIGAIEISVLSDLIIPLVLLTGIGLFFTYHYVYYVSKKTFPNYPEQAFISLFGMLTGTNSTGIILLREIDPQFETPAATNLILQSIYAIAFGFPLLLLLGIAPQGLTMTLISIGIMAVMFVVFNGLLFRNQLLARWKKK
jgi:ESS family glutamate:Na+ symporter